MKPDALTLWFAFPDDLFSTENVQACRSLLSENELTRVDRFPAERDRREYLAAHALVRKALSHSYALAPELWSFRTNEYGKPAIVQECGLQFNLAHSTKLVTCLVSSGVPVGVDVEPLESAPTILKIASSVFSAAELASLNELHSAERASQALLLWTLKEAYVKALGTGFSTSLKKFSFLSEGSKRIRLEPLAGEKGPLWFSALEHAGHQIALVTTHRAAPHLQIYEMRPHQGDPKRFVPIEPHWFAGPTR